MSSSTQNQDSEGQRFFLLMPPSEALDQGIQIEYHGETAELAIPIPQPPATRK